MRVSKILFVVLVVSMLLSTVAYKINRVDAGAPWPPTLLGPPNLSTVNSNPPRLCARYSDPEGQDGWGRFEVHGIGDEGAHISNWIPVINNRRFCWRDNGGPWRVGVHGWSARAKDSSGLQSAAAAEWSLTIPQAPSSRTRSRNANCTVNSISVAPAAPQRVGTQVTIAANATCTGGVKALRIRVNGTLLRTIRGSNGQIVWNTNGLIPDDYVITATATGKVNRARGSRSHTYLLTNASQPAQQNNPLPQPTNPPPPAPQQNNNSGNNSQNTESNNQSSTSVQTDCPSWEARLQVGGRGRSIVDGMGASPVRSQPENSNISFWIQEGDEFDVIGGPVCRPGHGEGLQTRYFEINFNGRTGWIAETNGTRYYLEPVSQPTFVPTTTNLVTFQGWTQKRYAVDHILTHSEIMVYGSTSTQFPTGRLQSERYYVISDYNNNWGLILAQEGRMGWINLFDTNIEVFIDPNAIAIVTVGQEIPFNYVDDWYTSLAQALGYCSPMLPIVVPIALEEPLFFLLYAIIELPGGEECIESVLETTGILDALDPN